MSAQPVAMVSSGGSPEWHRCLRREACATTLFLPIVLTCPARLSHCEPHNGTVKRRCPRQGPNCVGCLYHCVFVMWVEVAPVVAKSSLLATLLPDSSAMIRLMLRPPVEPPLNKNLHETSLLAPARFSRGVYLISVAVKLSTNRRRSRALQLVVGSAAYIASNHTDSAAQVLTRPLEGRF